MGLTLISGCGLQLIGAVKKPSTSSETVTEDTTPEASPDPEPTTPVGTTRSVECADLPTNAEWNTHTSATQTWNGTTWEPADLSATYSLSPSATHCYFTCQSGFGWAASACQISGSLDISFGGTGSVTIGDTVTTQNLHARHATVDSEGRILLGYYNGSGASQDIKVRRYLTDGTVDPSFNTSGLFTFAGPSGDQADYLWNMMVDSQDRPVIFGEIRNASTPVSFDALFMRLTTEGSLDTTVAGGSGYLIHDGASGTANLEDVSYYGIQDSSNRTIMVGFSTVTASTNYDATIWRITETGSLDTTFNSSGFIKLANTAASNNLESFTGVTEDAQNRIIACGSGRNAAATPNYDWLVARYTESGVLDTTFNATGYMIQDSILGATNGGDTCVRVKTNSAGQAIAGGYATNSSGNNDIVIVRYTETGTLDSTFGTSGKVVLSNIGGRSTSNDLFNDLFVDAQDRIYVTGQTQNATNTDALLVRLTSDGALDTTFNTTGYVLFDSNPGVANYNDTFRSISIDPLGRLVVLATVYNGATYTPVLKRYFP